MFSSSQILTLKICGAIIAVGLIILAIDRWVVKRGEPSGEQQLTQVVEQNQLQRVTSTNELDELLRRLQAFEAVTGQVQRIDTALVRKEASARLWLIEYQSRERSLIGANAPMARVDVPLFAILIELNEDPGWPPFVQQNPGDAPDQLPPDFAPRLLRMAEYRMAIRGRQVIFASQLQTAALMQSVQASTSPEFHPGLLNSAMRIDVQVAIDIVNALPGSPQLARFYKIEGIEVKLPNVDGGALSEGLRANQARIHAEQQAAREQRERDFERQRAEFRERNDEIRKQFRERMDAANQKLRDSGNAMRASDPVDKQDQEASASGSPRRRE